MTTAADVHVAMTELWCQAGRPPFRRIAKATGLTLSIAHYAVRGPSLANLEALTAVANHLGALARSPDIGPLLQLCAEAHQPRPLPSRRLSAYPLARHVWLVLDGAGRQGAMFVDDPVASNREALRIGGLVVQLPVVADYSAASGSA